MHLQGGKVLPFQGQGAKEMTEDSEECLHH